MGRWLERKTDVNVVVTENYEEMSAAAANVYRGAAEGEAGQCPRPRDGYDPDWPVCRARARVRRGREISFANAQSFNLDEYRGLPGTHDQSYRYFMQDNLFDHVDIDVEKTHVPDGSMEDAQAACDAYEQAIAQAGGVDLQLLGLGHNGHIGFNEPCDSFPVTTHCVELTESTIQANSRLFDSADEVPREAYTMGIGTIMKARKILLVVNGAGKAEIVRDVLRGPVVPQVPASILQLHPDVTVVLDKEAAAAL